MYLDRKVGAVHREFPAARDLRLLFFWPIFFVIFTYAEQWFPAASYYPMHCGLDDWIPFCEWFVLPYLLWFPFVGGMMVYSLFQNAASFRRMMHFIILTYSAALLIFFLFPTCQQLRPLTFSSHNLLTKWVAMIYAADTSTNVCPSIHVIGSLAVWFAAWDMKALPRLLRRCLIPVTAVLICMSTVFLKQHSALDVLAALVVCGAGYRVIYAKTAPEHLQFRGHMDGFGWICSDLHMK